MSKSFKLKNNNYIDSSSVSYNKQQLDVVIDNLKVEILKAQNPVRYY